ncbi:MAG TPA: carbohydrate ABC transporter permease [Spirochaetia bacterium]|nr:carbohydrate ABC transporter permease [Spirochaetia bacterium]
MSHPPRNRIRKPGGDYALISVAVVVTALWVLAGLFPPVWMALSAFKSSYEGTLFPPSFLPRMPQRVSVALAYDGGAVPSDAEGLLSLVRDDAFTAQWTLFDANPRNPMGEVQVSAYVDGREVYQSSLLLFSYYYGRNRIWSATILDRTQILKHKSDIQDGDTIRLYEKGLRRWPVGAGPQMPPPVISANKTAADSRDTLAGMGMAGTVHSLTTSNAPLRLFDGFIRGWQNVRPEVGPLRWGRYFINSAAITAGGILTQWLFTAFAAYGLSRVLRRRASGILTMFFLATMMIPAIATVIPLFLQMQRWGTINTFWSIILPAIPSGFLVYLFKGFFDALPGELFEAARMDGATDFWIFLRLVIPLSTAVFSVVTLMCFLGGWNGGGGLMWSSLVLPKEEMHPFPLALYYMDKTVPGYGALGQAQNQEMAMTLVASVPTLILFLFFQDRVAKGLVWSGLKQ